MDKQWYYSNGGSQNGPISEPELTQLVANQTLTKESLVWSEGMSDWSAAGQSLPHLFQTITPKPDLETTTAPSAELFKPVATASELPSAATSPKQLGVSDAYKAPTTSQPELSDEVYSMTPLQAMFSFHGRIRRSTYWLYTVITVGALIAVAFVVMAIFGDNSEAVDFAVMVCVIPYLWTSLAICVKRFHDRGKSGWWALILFVPYIGEIWAFIENGCLDGDYGSNQYGPDPKGGGFDMSRIR